MATQNNDSFPVDRPELSDTESDQEGKILETHAITTTVHEMKVKGYHLVEKKQETLVDPKASDSTPKMTILILSIVSATVTLEPTFPLHDDLLTLGI